LFNAIEMLPSSIVQPSGGERTTNSLPMLVEAPPLFSTMTGTPVRTCSGVAIIRDSTSVAPPGGFGATMRTILHGSASTARTSGACQEHATNAAAAAA
jgi:hypothetical protein